MHVIVASDTHIGWERSNDDDFKDFINNGVRDINPDKLILAGDIMEMWRRGISSILVERSDVLQDIQRLHEDGVDVIPLAGNHDWRFIESDAEGSIISEEPWQFQAEYRFSSGDEDFVVVHGHQGDPFNDSSPQNEGLCLTDDETSSTINGIYQTIIRKSITLNLLSKRAPLISRPNLGSLRSLSNPGFLAREQNKEVKDFVVRNLTRKFDDYVIAGHTHVPEVSDGYANCGAWAGNRNTYIEVKDGNVELKEWES